MLPPILVTKFFIPASRPELISRPHLIEQLKIGLHRKLTLISAPAGFGKTTLITEWLHGIQFDSSDENHRISTAWLSLDENDNDPVQFLKYFITALNQIEGVNSDFGAEALNMLQSPQPLPPETIMTALINDIAVTNLNMVLVLDDCHLIDNQAIHDGLSFFIDNQPPMFHLVIATREDPPLPLSRLRARGQLTELRAADLSFTSIEVTEFLTQVMGLGLAAEEITVLEARTEGWIAGLQLAALSMQGRDDTQSFIQSFAGSNRLVLDYLMDEVLARQPDEIQKFLLETALLDRLSGPLCDAVRFGGTETPDNTEGIAKGQHILENLEHSNLFIIPLDEERIWYRYHHLFADLLRQRLKQTQPDQLPEFHQRASLWYAQHGFRVEAIDHALLSADYERAIEMINADDEENYEGVSLLTLQRWLVAIPENLVATHPQMLLLKVWSQFNSGQIDDAEQNLVDVAQLLENVDEPVNPEWATLSGRALAIQAFIASLRGDPAGCAQLARQALDMLPAKEQDWRSVVTLSLGDAYAVQGQMADAQKIRTEALQLGQSAGNPFILLMANLNLAETLWQQGQIVTVIEICERQMQFATDHDLAETPIIGWLLGLWGTALAELNQMEQALVLTRKGVELAERGQDMFYINHSYLCRVRVLFSAGDMAGAESILHELRKFGQNSMLPLWATSQVAAWQARIWLEQDKMTLVSQWETEHELTLDDDIPFAHESEYVALARIWLSQGKSDDAVALLSRLKAAAEIGGRDLQVVELLLVLALAAPAKGDNSQALSLLEKALILGEPKGLIQTFVNEGPPLASLLYAVLQQEIEPAYVQKILAAFPIESQHPSDEKYRQETGWLEPLTDRELEILQYVAEGLTNPKIGARLYLSPNTVKTHLRNIFGKLDVNNRLQAVAKGRSLGIISDN
jgi:LuxR family transcriptional regulator, maltose regulon positive regulatory protein